MFNNGFYPPRLNTGTEVGITRYFEIKQHRKALSRYEIGGSGETRTRDQRIKSPLLYRLSYRPTLHNKVLYSAKPKIVVEIS